MLTPQEITDKVFIKAIFGGYDMTGVDNFLEAVCSDYTALYKENAILKGKLKVLVEKVEEYRSTEDSMRMALLTAQRMGEEITKEANKQKDETLRNADMEVKSRLAESARKIADEELRLNVAAKETAKFIELSHAIIRKHSEFLTKLETARRAVSSGSVPAPAPSGSQTNPHQPIPAPIVNAQVPVTSVPQPSYAETAQPSSREAQIADAASIIGNAMERLTGGAANAANAMPLNETGATSLQAHDDDDAGQTKIYSISGDDDSVTSRPRFDFEDLKFGSNFNPDE